MWSPLRCFVAVALVIGGAAVVLNPAFGGYDEADHFVRAWQISEGTPLSDSRPGPNGIETHGGVVAKQLYVDIATLKFASEGSPGESSRVFEHLDDDPPSGEKAFIEFPATAAYSPVSYIGSAAGIRVGRWIGLSTFGSLLAARFAGLCLYVGIIARAMQHAPRRRWLLAAIALAPVALLQAATVSADGITIGLAVLAIAFAMRAVAIDQTEPMTKPLIIEGFVIAVMLGLAKPPYVLFLAVLVVAVVRSAALRRRLLWCAIGASGFVASALWSSYAQAVYKAPARLSNVDSGRQLRFVAAHPLSFVAALWSTFVDSGLRTLHEMFVAVPAWDPGTAVLVGLAVPVLVALVVAVGRRFTSPVDVPGDAPFERPFEGPSDRLVLYVAIAVAGLVTLVSCLLAYAGWNPVGASRIDELQGRYLYPGLVLAILVIGYRRGRDTKATTVGALAVSVISAIIVGAISIHYYI